MNTVMLVIIMVVFISLLVVVVSSPIEKNQTKDYFDEFDLSVMTATTYYVGGIKTVLEKTTCSLILMKDKINVRIGFKDVDMLVSFNQITNVKLLSEEQLLKIYPSFKLSEDDRIYIDKRKNNVREREYIVINYMNSEKGSEEVLIFEYNDGQTFVDKYNDIFNTWADEFYCKNEISVCKCCASDC